MELSGEPFCAVFTVKDGPGIVIDKVLDVLNVGGAVIAYGGAFRDETTDKTVLILVGSSFGRAIRVAVIYRCSFLSSVR